MSIFDIYSIPHDLQCASISKTDNLTIHFESNFELSGHRRDAVAVSENGGSSGAIDPSSIHFPGPADPEQFSDPRNSTAPSPPYLDLVDKVSFEAKTDILRKLDEPANCNWLTATCGKGKGYFIWAEHEDDCDCKARYAKELVCNKEWCEICGDDDSIAHNRRFLRWLTKIRQFKTMGYFVFTLPEEIRGRYRTKKDLARWGHDVQEILKNHGYDRGLRRLHYFGDKSSKWHPHLNILVESGFIDGKALDSIKTEYAELLQVPIADVFYEYRKSPGEMVHTLKYVTRATFRNYEWDEEMALELHGFRNMVVWGRPDRIDKETGEILENEWRDRAGDLSDSDAVWSVEDLDQEDQEILDEIDVKAVQSIGSGICPECGRELKWSDALPSVLLKEVVKTPLGVGYYRLEDKNARAGPGRPLNYEKISEKDLKKARGDNDRLEKLVNMARRSAVFISQCLDYGIDHQSNSVHCKTYDAYWDNPESEGFIDPGGEVENV